MEIRDYIGLFFEKLGLFKSLCCLQRYFVAVVTDWIDYAKPVALRHGVYEIVA